MIVQAEAQESGTTNETKALEPALLTEETVGLSPQRTGTGNESDGVLVTKKGFRREEGKKGRVMADRWADDADRGEESNLVVTDKLKFQCQCPTGN